MGTNPPTGGAVSRQIAYALMFIAMVGSGISLSLLLMGQRELALQVCGGFVVILVIALLVGSYLVARNR